MNDRIRALREKLKLSRSAFGEKLGVSGDVINNLERGRVPTKESMIKLICACYDVNEEWLRSGSGEIFIPLPASELKDLADKFPNITHETYILVEKLINLPKASQDIVMEFLREVVEDIGDVAPSTLAKAPLEMTDAELHAELDRQLSLEEKVVENQLAFGHGSSSTAAG